MKLLKTYLTYGFAGIMIILFIVNDSFAQNLIKNEGFETGALSPQWGTWPAGENPTVTIDATNAYKGNFSVKISNLEGYLYQTVNLEPNTKYKISTVVKTQAGDAVYFGVKNVWGTTGVSMVFNQTYFKADSLFFTTGNEIGNSPEIYLWKGSGAGGAWADDFKLTAEINTADEPGGAGAYYVSPTGNDNNTGTSPQDAWQTIGKVNRMDFEPGDSILFKGGNIFSGSIQLKYNDTGSAVSGVHLGSYGTERATINAGTGSGLTATDCEYVSIKNINFIGDGRKTGNTGNGITFSFFFKYTC
jgi:hypothetical protein